MQKNHKKGTITSSLEPKISPLIVIVGETASGKSALAMGLALQFNGEIICADSWTVRREVNIGTAKPTLADRRFIRHHLLDIVSPCEEFTAAVFKRLAVAAIEEISSRGKLPIMVGGTGLYVDSVVYDFSFLPPGDRAAREEFNLMSSNELLILVKQRGMSVEGIDIGNKRRLIRLLETGGVKAKRHILRPNTLILGVPITREALKERIITRVDHMLAAGLEKEVRHLVSTYGWQCEALKGIGYSEWQDYLNGSTTLIQTREKIIADTLNLAKRQRTWFKRNDSICWLKEPSEGASLVAKWLQTGSPGK